MSKWDTISSLFAQWKQSLTEKTSCFGLDKILGVALARIITVCPLQPAGKLGVQFVSELLGEFLDLLEFEDDFLWQHAFADAFDIGGNRTGGGG